MSMLRVATLSILLAAWTAAVRADDSPPLTRIVFGSCIQQDRPMPILEAMAAESPQLAVMLGDNIYADTDSMRVMRDKYAQLGANPQFQKLRGVCPLIATWDDHDYGRNDGGADYPQREASQQVFLDFWNEPADSPRRRRPGVYDARLYGPEGRRVQILMLDTRYFRSPLKKGQRRVAGVYVPDDDASKTMLGEEQWKWLAEQLRVPAELRIIATSIQCLPEAVGQETWGNLPHERQRLLDLIASTEAKGVVFISGDRHWSELSRVAEGVPYPLYEITSSSLNQIHPRGTPSENRFRALATTIHQPNFGLIEIDWEAEDPRVSLQIRDVQGRLQLEQALRLSSLSSPE